MKHLILYLILCCSTQTTVWCQSLIFSGGTGDGTDANCFLENDVLVFGFYTGGNEDGAGVNCFLQSTLSLQGIYTGGDQDGASISCYTQQSENQISLFFGGINDGASKNCYMQSSFNSSYFLYYGGTNSGDAVNCFLQPSELATAIYKGGNGDGFDVYCFTQNLTPNLSIFNGGQSDGTDVYCYLQPLPLGSEQIFYGGIDDGYSVDCQLQLISVGNYIFGGGIDDGSTVNCHLQIIPTGFSLFSGGINDGFDVNCFAQTDYLDVVLPIELTYFSAELNDERNVDLTWETVTEYNNDYFIVERSTNLYDWEEIAEVDGAGTSTEPLEYYHEDTDPYIGDNYYRLIQVDFDGDFNVSQVITVNLDKKSDHNPQLLIYPNPVTELLNIQLSDYESGEYSIEIYNDLGQMIYTKSIWVSNETEIYQINREPNMISGFYFVLTNSADGNEKKSRKVIFN